MMAFSVAEKAARLAGSFNTSSADRASSADIEGVDGELPASARKMATADQGGRRTE